MLINQYQHPFSCIKVRDGYAIQMANTKIEEIRQGFVDWLGRTPDTFKQQLSDRYNRLFNCFVRPNFDGTHQTFPYLDLRRLGIADLYKSQKDAVWMLKTNGGGICDHEVGAGKTLIMCTAAYEMKRLGLANKPMIIGLKANVFDMPTPLGKLILMLRYSIQVRTISTSRTDNVFLTTSRTTTGTVLS